MDWRTSVLIQFIAQRKYRRTKEIVLMKVRSDSNRITNKLTSELILLLFLEQIINAIALRCCSVCGFERSRTQLFRCVQQSSLAYLTRKSYLVDPASNICLFKRLSHACLSINIFIQWNCVQLIISVIIYLKVTHYMDNCSNSRANTCVKFRLSGRNVFIR